MEGGVGFKKEGESTDGREGGWNRQVKAGVSLKKKEAKYEIKDKSFSGQKFRSRRDRQSKTGLKLGEVGRRKAQIVQKKEE